MKCAADADTVCLVIKRNSYPNLQVTTRHFKSQSLHVTAD